MCKGVRDTIARGKSCFQIPSSRERLEDMSEDCLNLNVIVPHSSNVSALPVMVWVHKGLFLADSVHAYDGSFIAAIGKVIYVAMNYRLGAFGFLAIGKHSDLRGNYGMLDQVKALKWVKQNIAKFGGDPNKVTVFGNSAGGASASLLSLSPLANDLFQSTIMQSGVATSNWAVIDYRDAVGGAKQPNHCF
ncbi:hypothetical protein QZH41_016363 [Actinostola sp. cb2023]|nr:hypothetical protein QZH41_016363 [Actinostola sp. cb2023]